LNDFDAFCKAEADWLDDFALFVVLKEHFSGSPWMGWDDEFKRRDPEALATAREKFKERLREHQFRQWIFFMQWSKVVAYAHALGIRIVGDMPIFVAQDGADVWSNQDIFQLDTSGNPTVVAGVPPDYFSTTGQLWGNPLYNWNALRRRNFDWWVKRIRFLLRLVDQMRIDHFRGFDGYWEVPAGMPTAEYGRWVRAPGYELFGVLEREVGSLGDFMIAEDLGVITPSVVELRDAYHIPGMKILQFAFTNPTDAFLPHNYDTANCIVYTGTHDNNTVLGWYEQETWGDTRVLFRAYAGHDVTEPHWDMIRMGMQSIAAMAIVPLQDVLGLGVETRMNAPGATARNWSWRFLADQLTPDLSARLHSLTELYNRLPS
jgi:4-alpha-glucanotransferase